MDLTLLSKVQKSMVRQTQKYKHNKTGNIYMLLYSDICECTNGREDIRYCLYANEDGKLFCRTWDEFNQKFTKI